MTRDSENWICSIFKKWRFRREVSLAAQFFLKVNWGRARCNGCKLERKKFRLVVRKKFGTACPKGLWGLVF